VILLDSPRPGPQRIEAYNVSAHFLRSSRGFDKSFTFAPRCIEALRQKACCEFGLP